MVCMSRPRFRRLRPEQQSVILDAALQEFATHGFAAASLNRIIEATGTSKGAIYYYFDGKEDLYAEVLRRQVERMLEHGGPLRVPDATDADAFWGTIEEYYLRLMRLLAQTPETGTLLRDWLSGAVSPALRDAESRAEQDLMPWLMTTVATGQRVGAVREDLPADLLVAVALGMGQAMDAWLIVQPPERSDLADSVHSLMDMMRRALSPAG